MTAYKHIQAVCKRAKMPYELSMELKPTWSGYLALDSDDINVFRHKEHLLIAVDVGTLDIPNALLCRHQGQLDWELLLETLKQLHYPFKAIISDGALTLLSAVKRSLLRLSSEFVYAILKMKAIAFYDIESTGCLLTQSLQNSL